MEIRGRLNYKS